MRGFEPRSPHTARTEGATPTVEIGRHPCDATWYPSSLDDIDHSGLRPVSNRLFRPPCRPGCDGQPTWSLLRCLTKLRRRKPRRDEPRFMRGRQSGWWGLRSRPCLVCQFPPVPNPIVPHQGPLRKPFPGNFRSNGPPMPLGRRTRAPGGIRWGRRLKGKRPPERLAVATGGKSMLSRIDKTGKCWGRPHGVGFSGGGPSPMERIRGSPLGSREKITNPA